METTFDIQTSAGIAAATIVIIELLKKIIIDSTTYFIIKTQPWYPTLTNLSTLVISIGLSFLAMYLFDVELITSLGNGLMGFLLAIGGYEPIVNLIRGIMGKENK